MTTDRTQKPDSLIRQEGMNVLLDKLGKVDAERFISMVLREPFDYTKWQENLFEKMTLSELCDKAMSWYNTKIQQ
ncbi:MAG: hypothetical protein PHS83_03085 [Clostridia bacterium]|jgi:hypothetical protein|nr:hypothetical protein [Clostridia bacterium]MDD4146073.1 hypothetical protein [Clostridia bacterium]MDD4665883.1 hypothetical protein [Clostridia bacterium]